MKRRDLALGLAAAPLFSRPALAQGEPVEGKDYKQLSQTVAVAVPGKIEVIEFFGYWCPHCRNLEPKLEGWAKKLPADVNLRRIPVGWRPVHEPFQRLYFALEQIGAPGEIHAKVFDALQVQGQRLESEAGAGAFAAANGLDKAKLVDAMKGFTVASKVRMANQLWAAYRLDGVPAMAVHGRFTTSPEQAGSDERALQVVDALIRKARTIR